MKRLLSFLSRNRLPILLIILILFLSYGQTLFMYFWQDDSALIFKLQNPEGPAGSFGSGIWQRGAYQYLVVPFVPFFPLFGLEPFGYFLGGFVTYALATAGFYYFAKTLTENRKLSLWSTLLFAAGYVGSDTMFRVINSWQTNIGIALALVTFAKYIECVKKPNLKKYLTSFLLFLLTIELVYVRSHSIIFPILIVDLLFSHKNIKKLIVRQIPFWVAFYLWFLQDANFGGPGIKSIFSQVILEQKIYILAPLFANIGNIFIPDIFFQKLATIFAPLVKDFGLQSQFVIVSMSIFISVLVANVILVKKRYISRRSMMIILSTLTVASGINLLFLETSVLWYRDLVTVLSGASGISLGVFSLLFFATHVRKYFLFAVSILFAYAIAASQIFGYYSQYPTAIFSTAHRYQSYSFIGFCLFWGALFYFLHKNTRFKVLPQMLLFALLSLNLFLGIRYQSQILTDRSIPSRKFYQDLRKFVSNVEKGSTFYFDVAQDPYTQKQFGDFFSVGSMPETTALAIYYNLDRYDVQMITEFDELLYKISQNQIDVQKLHTFFYDSNGLKDTTTETKSLINDEQKDVSINLSNVKLPSLMPNLVNLSLVVDRVKNDKFPFIFNQTSQVQTSFDKKLKMLGLLSYLKDYYAKTEVMSTSEWKFREIRNAYDQSNETAWQGHRILWGERHQEAITIDLKSPQMIGGLAWRNWTVNLAPTKYNIEVSRDGENWIGVKNVDIPIERKNSEIVTETFEPTIARFIRMNIFATQTDDSPALLEVIAIPPHLTNISIDESYAFIANPFAYVENESQWDSLYQSLEDVAYVNVHWKANNSTATKTMKVPVKIAPNEQQLQFVLPAGGTEINSIQLIMPFPSKLEVKNIFARNLSVKELESRNLVKEFSEN